MLKKPTILVFAGPNGSGKSTVTKAVKIIGTYINADEIKKQENCTDLEAAQLATSLREQLVREKKDFTFETVLSSRRNLDLLINAKQEGFFIKCFYVLTVDSSVNVQRVAVRVMKGGHNVPEEKIRNRYNKCMQLIPELIEVCDVIHIYDNTTEKPERIFKKKKNESTIWESQLWNEEKIRDLISKK